jgi:hypothetical protein
VLCHPHSFARGRGHGAAQSAHNRSLLNKRSCVDSSFCSNYVPAKGSLSVQYGRGSGHPADHTATTFIVSFRPHKLSAKSGLIRVSRWGIAPRVVACSATVKRPVGVGDRSGEKFTTTNQVGTAKPECIHQRASAVLPAEAVAVRQNQSPDTSAHVV